MEKITKTIRFSDLNGICLIKTLFIGFTIIIIANSKSTAGDVPPCLLPVDRILTDHCYLHGLRHQNELLPHMHSLDPLTGGIESQ